MSATAFNFMRRRQKELEEKRKKLAGVEVEAEIPKEIPQKVVEKVEEKPLEEHTNAELKEILDSREIEYNAKATKSELLELIK